MAIAEDYKLLTSQGPAIQISPDDSTLAYLARPKSGNERSRLFLRRWSQPESTVVEGTEGISQFCWKPDGTSIAFFAETELKIYDVQYGTIVPVTKFDEPQVFRGLDWGTDGHIVFAGVRDGVFRIAETGLGEVETFTELITSKSDQENEGIEISHRRPQMLPEGKGVLYTVLSRLADPNRESIMLQPLEDGKPTGAPFTLHKDGHAARYLPNGYMVFLSHGSLFAAPFDLDSLRFKSTPTLLLTNVLSNFIEAGHFTVSSNGTLVYLNSDGMDDTDEQKSVFNWIDRSGKHSDLGLTADVCGDFHLSLDGRFLAYEKRAGEQNDIYIYDTERRGFPGKLTSGEADKLDPVWSPTGQGIVYLTNQADSPGLHWQRRDRLGQMGQPVLLPDPLHVYRILSWHQTSLLIIARNMERPYFELKVVHLEGNDRDGWKAEEVTTIPATIERRTRGNISPNGKWVSFNANFSGSGQVYVYSLGQNEFEPYPISLMQESSYMPIWMPGQNQLIFGTLFPEDTEDRSSNMTQIFTSDYHLEGKEFKSEAPVRWERAEFFGGRSGRVFDFDQTNNRLLVTEPYIAPGEELRQVSGKDHVILFENFFEFIQDTFKTSSNESQ